MTYGAPPGWYPDPAGSGGRRYFDGVNWTGWATGSPANAGYGYPYGPAGRWKGSRFGLPPYGPGSLASPGTRLVARFLDALVLSPLYITFYVVMIDGFVHRANSLMPPPPTPSNPTPTVSPQQLHQALSGLFTVFALWFVFFFAVTVLYEGGLTARYGRTLDKKWMGIRPVTPDGARLTRARSYGRVGAVYVAGFASVFDPLWCLWDDSSQCLHDKIASTVVVTDSGSGGQWQSGRPPGQAGPWQPQRPESDAWLQPWR